jgi:dipeptidyl aminopeptidase/acylaminoacyl peptidase
MTANSLRAGLWPSEISAEKANSGVSRPQYPELVEGRLSWVEGRPLEGGRKVLVVREADGNDRTVTPDGFNLRTRVHEYGGRAHAFLPVEGLTQVVFVNSEDQALYFQPMDGGSPRRLSAPAPEGEEWRFADLVALPGGAGLIAVCEHHGTAAEPRNLLVYFSIESSVEPVVLHDGPDFVAMPAVSVDGSQVAWIQWDHPSMQWDSSELWTARLDFAGERPCLVDCARRAGGPNHSVWQPLFLRDGGLVYVMDGENLDDPQLAIWQLYLSREPGEALRLTHGQMEFGEPFWVTGESRIAELEGGDLLAICTDGQGDALVRVPLDGSGASDVLARIRVLLQLVPCPGGAVFVGINGLEPANIYSWSESGLSRLAGVDALLLPEQVSEAESMACPSRDGRAIHAWYYPPCHPTRELAEGESPPLIVKAHGGPTAHARSGFELETQYWTSRGFALVDVNYRGSTGLGRSYRQALQGRWGDLDIDDVVDVVEHLVRTGRADRDGVFIRGGSAGGYVVLRVMTRDPDLWAGGACRYGIGNLGSLAATTHKFEARYIDGLMGLSWKPGLELEPGNPYHDRSPIFFIDQMKAPVVLFQGSEDKVVPPEVSREMVETLQAAGVPTEYHEYEGEGHGFRKAENRVHSLDAELRFFQGVLQGD